MRDINSFLKDNGISLEKLEVDEPTSNLPYSVEEFDKVKTRVMKYVTYKKRTEKEVRDKFRDMFDETILSDVIEKIKELGYINEDDYVERSFNEFIALKTISVKEIKTLCKNMCYILAICYSICYNIINGGYAYMTFSEIVKQIRIKRNYTQEQFARELNVSFSTINRWENGHTVPSGLAKMRLLEYCKKNYIDDEVLTELSKC